MNIYKVRTKKGRDQGFWDDMVYLVRAKSFGDAETKSNSYLINLSGGFIHSIELAGESVSDDLIKIHER